MKSARFLRSLALVAISIFFIKSTTAIASPCQPCSGSGCALPPPLPCDIATTCLPEAPFLLKAFVPSGSDWQGLPGMYHGSGPGEVCLTPTAAKKSVHPSGSPVWHWVYRDFQLEPGKKYS